MVSSVANGNPLAITLIGSSLCGKTKSYQESEVKKLKQVPNQDIQKVLKWSLDGLDWEEKEMFLDIACCFKGEDRDHVTSVMDACYVSAHSGIENLIDKSLISVSENKIAMHDLLQQMGWNIVREESPLKPEKRSRLWIPGDNYDVLVKNKGSKTLTGIVLDMFKHPKLELEPKALMKMRKLRFLKFYRSCGRILLPKGLLSFSEELRYLYWEGYPLRSLPKFDLRYLVELDMRNSHLEQLWEGKQDLVNLKVINLTNSLNLVRIPDLSSATNLEKIILSGCSNLRELHSSLQHLKNLTDLDFWGCKNLTSLPSFYKATSLTNLYISDCYNLFSFPKVSPSVTELYLGGMAIEELPSSIECLSNLRLFSIQDCRRPKSIPTCIHKLESLEEFFLNNCSRLETFPEILDTMERLSNLDLSGTALKELPSSIGNLIGLNCLILNNCENLVCVPDSFYKLKSLEELVLSGCSRLEIFPEIKDTMKWLFCLDLSGTALKELPSSIDNLIGLYCLSLNNCENLVCLPDSFYKLKSLVELDLQGCSRLEIFPEIKDTMDRLFDLDLSKTALKELPSSFGNLIGVYYLKLNNCENLVCLPDSFYKLKSLGLLNLQGCSRLEIFPEIKDTMECVRQLDLSGTALKELPSSIDNLIVLEELRLNNCENLICLPNSFYKLKSLGLLNLQGCSRLEIFSEIVRLLGLSGTALKELPSSIDNLIGLKKLRLNNCENLICLPDSFYKLESLEKLDLQGCSRLEIFPEIKDTMEYLYELNLSGTALKELPSSIDNLIALKYLILNNCEKLIFLPDSFYELKSLERLDLCGRSNLVLRNLLTSIGGRPVKQKHLRRLSWLWRLNLSESNLENLPTTIKQFRCLKELILRKCKRLKSLPELPPSLTCLDAHDCTSLEDVSSIKKLFEQALFCQDIDEDKVVSSLPFKFTNVVSSLTLKFTNCFKLGEKGVGNDIDADDSTSVEEVSSIKKVLKQAVFCKSLVWLFTNCFQLVQKSVSSAETPKLEMPFEQMVTVLKDYHQAPPESKKGTRIVTCVPGSEIPEWFDFKSSGSSINIPLPSEWWINFPYFVASIVVSSPDYCDSYEVTEDRISCQYVLKSCNGDSEDLGGYFSIEFEEGLSDHMFLLYEDIRVLEFVESEASNKHFYNQASFDFKIDGWTSESKPSQYKVKQCGVHLSFAN